MRKNSTAAGANWKSSPVAGSFVEVRMEFPMVIAIIRPSVLEKVEQARVRWPAWLPLRRRISLYQALSFAGCPGEDIDRPAPQVLLPEILCCPPEMAGEEMQR
jgi:hypothetical protein